MDIFVGSLPFKLKENQLKEIFEKYGEVKSVTIILNKLTRQNKGFGFVEMPNEKEALEAIKHLNGFEIMGRSIMVNKSESKQLQETPKKGGGNPTTNHKTNGSVFYKKKFKPKENVIVYGEPEKKSAAGKEFVSRKKAKNFKVGKRRKQ